MVPASFHLITRHRDLALALLKREHMRTRTLLSPLILASLCSLANADDRSDHERRLSIATDPIGLFGGQYALSASYVTSRWAALRADIQIVEQQSGLGGIGVVGSAGSAGLGGLAGGASGGVSGGWRASIGLPIYLDRPLHGPYVEPSLALAERTTGYAAVGSIDNMTTVLLPQHERSLEPQIFVGWQWLFDSGLHLGAAIGVARHFATDGSGTSYSIPQSYLRIGYAL